MIASLENGSTALDSLSFNCCLESKVRPLFARQYLHKLGKSPYVCFGPFCVLVFTIIRAYLNHKWVLFVPRHCRVALDESVFFPYFHSYEASGSTTRFECLAPMKSTWCESG